MMSENERHCFCVRTNVGAIIIGICSCIVFGVVAIISGALLDLAVKQKEIVHSSNSYPIRNILGIEIKQISINAALVAILIVSALATFFSVLLVIGVLKRLSGLVLLFFCSGLMTAILMLLGCLLLLIHNIWYISIVLFIATVFYVPCLVAVYKFYQDLVSGRHLNFSREDSIEEELLDENTLVSGTNET